MLSTVTPPATYSTLLDLATAKSSFKRLTILNDSATDYKFSPNGGATWCMSLGGTSTDIDAHLLGSGFGNILIEGASATPADVHAWII